jgi:hypothetical protein
MSDENEEQQPQMPHPIQMMFGMHRPPTQEEMLARKKSLSDFAKASLPQLREMQRLAREVYVLYMDSPAQAGQVSQRHQEIRQTLALMIEDLEGYAAL